VVRLVVVQNDIEKAADDAAHEANPRPRLRGDCEPLSCPHCGKQVAMRLGEDEDGLTITCPECAGRVAWHGFLDEWVPDGEGLGFAPSPAMLNHCRPCPWVGCVQHLFLDVMDHGASIRMNFPSKEPWELGPTCALDEAEKDGMTLDEVGKTINITRERVRQLIEQAIKTSRKNTNSELFKSAIDLEDLNDLPELRHPLTEAE
jgi:hypothetical protein